MAMTRAILLTLLVCAVVLLLVVPGSDAGWKSKLKHDYSVATVAEKLNCHVNTRRQNIVQLKDGTHICRYRGKWHDIAASWFDTSRCMQCRCLAPVGIGCCQILLKPVNIPKRCEVDPHPRWSKLPRLASCMAPIVSVKSRKKACKNKRLREALLRTRWTSIRGQSNFLRAVHRGENNP